ncbi:CPBP family glutamic-type intramembrane protease [Elizabethkingia anophelis]|uniref:CPBP family glutamic-type intramembrane protease n=1 Tax=Elizabethkingia anophelis TaxID=1117645 RepID=UPI003D16B21E
MKKRGYKKIIYFSLVNILYGFLVSSLLDYFGINESNIGKFKFRNTTQEVFGSLIISPIFETIIFQYLIYKIIYSSKVFIQKFIMNDEDQYLIFYLSVSSILFAISHSYSVHYILLMLFPGVIFSYSFYYFKKYDFYPISSVFFIHFSHNLVALIYDKL